MSGFGLRLFTAVARHLSFTKAGQELFVSQPAVTRHIRELEAQYGQRPVERRGNRVSLTEAGRLRLGASVRARRCDHLLISYYLTRHGNSR